MADTIKCACSSCGAKYRLPVEAQGRSARCKRCGKTFQIPRAQKSLEDSILDWLAAPPEEDEDVAQPRIISMPNEPTDEETAKRVRGPIRMKTDSANVKK
jgi:hypothetical protein